jgi:hypothetical protein
MKTKDLNDIFANHFPDARIARRAASFLEKMIIFGSAVINRCCLNHAEKIGAYRMINNKRFTMEDLQASMYADCCRNAVGLAHVLCVQDTSKFDLTQHMGRIGADDPDVGPISEGQYSGVLLHPSLVIDPDTETPVGISYVLAWNRDGRMPDKRERKYQRQPMEQKESYRWIESPQESRKNLPPGLLKTIIADRESDIYQALCDIPCEDTHVLFRSSHNRELSDGSLLLDTMRSLERQCEYTFRVAGNKSRKSRMAKVELRYGEVSLKRPHTCPETYRDTLSINCIYVVESADTVPEGEDPIEWRLYTTHRLETAEDAMQCVRWYSCRWYIEELFRVMKKQGLQLESAQLESGESIKKLLCMSLLAAIRIMCMKIAFDKKEVRSKASLYFDDSQIRCLKILGRAIEGKTEKQKNPFVPNSLAWAAWIIARLGGWGGYISSSKPGYITMKVGLDRFMAKYEMFKLMKDVYKE